MKPKVQAFIVVLCTIAILASVMVYRYTFPKIEKGSSAIGVAQLERQWWRGTALVSFDRDGDGRIDSRILYPDSSGDYSPHQLPLESWDDIDGDGRLEVHILYEGDKAVRVEIDTNGDGRGEKVLLGAQADAYFHSLKHSSKPRQASP
jgi:hypothetical protein